MKISMSNKVCRKWQNDKSEIKQRYIPTFVHHPIFQDQPFKNNQNRFNPTFYSTVLDTDGYNVKRVHCSKQKCNPHPQNQGQNVIYSNYSHERRIQDLNPKVLVFYSSKDKWYDHTKQDIFSSMRYRSDLYSSKQRKQIELASAPVFTDFNYEDKKYVSLMNECTKNPTLNIVNPQTTIPRNLNFISHINQTQINQKKQPTVILQSQQIQNLKKINQEKTKTEKRTQNNLNTDFIPQQSTIPNNKAKRTMTRSQSVPKNKVASKNPTFSIVRGNKISNHL